MVCFTLCNYFTIVKYNVKSRKKPLTASKIKGVYPGKRLSAGDQPTFGFNFLLFHF